MSRAVGLGDDDDDGDGDNDDEGLSTFYTTWPQECSSAKWALTRAQAGGKLLGRTRKGANATLLNEADS